MFDSGSSTPPTPFRWPKGLAAAVVLLIIGYLIFARGVDRDLNHDEHQFIAPAVLLARGEALPYRDYPLMHLPNLVGAYAGMIRLFGDPVFGPKLLCFGSSILLAAILMVVTVRSATRYRLFLGCVIPLLFLFDPLYLYTAGKTWNHEVPALLFIAALLFHVESFRRNSAGWLAVSAALAGLAVGCRLTLAPVLIPLALVTFLYPVALGRRWMLAGLYTAVATLSLSPSLYFLVTSPEQFVFGNLQFPRLPLLDPENERIQKTMTKWRKLRYLVKEVLIPSWPVVVAFALAGVAPGVAWLRRRTEAGFGNALILLVLPFALLGIFSPSRYQYQHCYLLIPLLLLGAALGFRHLPLPRLRFAPLAALILLLASAGSLYWEQRKEFCLQTMVWVRNGFHPEEWFRTKARTIGEEITEHYPQGRVLTLAPVWPLTAGLEIYPEFASAPFAWRNSRFVPVERRPRLHLIAPDDLEAFLAAGPKPAILTGVEDDYLEEAFVAYAQKHGYRMEKLKRKRKLWLPPAN